MSFAHRHRLAVRTASRDDPRRFGSAIDISSVALQASNSQPGGYPVGGCVWAGHGLRSVSSHVGTGLPTQARAQQSAAADTSRATFNCPPFCGLRPQRLQPSGAARYTPDNLNRRAAQLSARSVGRRPGNERDQLSHR